MSGYYGTGIRDERAARAYLKRKHRQTPLPEIQVRPGRRFYVTIRDGNRYGLLLGPYISHMTALANVARGRRLAMDAAPGQAPFAAFGTSSLPTTQPTVFGR